jgi:hypothetical protein
VVNELCSDPRDLASAGARIGAAGLLFGTAEQNSVAVERFKAFAAADSSDGGAPKREDLDAALKCSLADPDISSLQLVGWYCVRSPNDVASLSDSDIEFHNSRFRRATDLALILKPKEEAGVAIELYGRSSLRTALLRHDYRFGSLMLADAAGVNAPMQVGMLEIIGDDHHLKLFQALDSVDRAGEREGWKKIALWVKRITRLRPEWMRTRLAREVHTPISNARGLPVQAGTDITVDRGGSTTKLNSPVPGSRSPQSQLPWISSAVLLALATAVALTWLYARPLLSGLTGNASFLRIRRSAPLNLRVQRQPDGSLLVRWDAYSAAVRSAKDATIQIDDGSEHRDLKLDSTQVANGSILYTPTSRDLTFRLEVFEGKGAPISQWMRVVDGSQAALAGHNVPSVRSSTLAQAKRAPVQKRAQRLDTISHIIKMSSIIKV